MARTSAVLQPVVNRAPYVALVTLCFLAGASILGVVIGWGFRRSGAPTSTRSAAELAQAEAAVLGTVNAPPALPSSGLPQIQMVLPQAGEPGLPFSTSQPTIPDLQSRPTPQRPSTVVPKLPLDKQIKNPRAMQGVMTARGLRDQGDMQAAIEALKESDLTEPNHPEILGEMAITYEEMGIASKAEALWRQIYTMGEGAAGGYYALASSKIGNPEPAISAPGSSIPVPVTLGPCRLSCEPLAKEGEHVTVHVPILAHPGATIDPSKIEIHVTLYESVSGGERVEAVPPDKTAQSWSTLPLNWAEPAGEAAEVTYDLLSVRPGSKDTRSFHGYAVKLYYQNKLVGEQAQPDALRNAPTKNASPAGLDNALFPK